MRTLLTLLLILTLFALACGGTTSGGVYRTPMVERGACATILMPGQTMPMPEPGETPGCPGGYASIAGGGVVEESDKVTKTEPHPAVKVLTAPFAILLFPFKLMVLGAEKLGDLVEDEEPPLDPRLRRAQPVKTVAVDPQTAREREQLGALERELEQRGGKGLEPAGRATAPRPAQRAAGERSSGKVTSRSGGPTTSGGTASAAATPGPLDREGQAASRPRRRIADELAALRSGAPPSSSAAPTPAVDPPVSHTPAEPPADRVLDRDGDGRPDHWIHLQDGQIARELFDDDADGTPDRTVWRDPVTGHEQRVEEDRNGDGRVDTVAEYKDGALARVRRDADHDGAPDAWSFYRAGKLVREEQDPDGDGFRNRVAVYRDGRLVSEREDRDGDGRIDRLTRYDAEERVAQRDEDQDGDGLVDARAFYEAGRLVRRELVSETQGGAIEDEEDLSNAAWSVDEARP